MSTIRPLATIAILAGLGVFLAQQINKPKQSGLVAQGELPDAYLPAPDAEEAPAFDGGGAAPSFDAAGLAPAAAPPLIDAPGYGSQPAAPTPPAVPATASSPGLPPLPVLPGGVTEPAIAPPTQPLVDNSNQGMAPLAGPGVVGADLNGEIPMPDNVAEANYDGLPVDDLPLTPPSAAPMAAEPTTPPPYGAPPAPSETTDPYAEYAPGNSPVEPADASLTTPIEPVMPVEPAGEGPAYSPLGSIPASPKQSLAQAMPMIDQALARGDLVKAHELLSPWYGDPSISPAERSKVNELLSQLAGSVVYSTSHRLEPPYSVKPGETLETIAQQYNVPWRLLAKINGVPSANSVRPGDTIKVIRGPFKAVVDATNKELVLMIDGKYAGRFAVQLSGAANTEGAWRVEQKPQQAPSPTYGAIASTGKQLVLKGAAGSGTLVIGPAGGSPRERGRVAVASTDLNELHDILSVGSEVVIRK